MDAVKTISPHSGDLILMVGTVKGAFILRADRKRREFHIAGPYFKGMEVFRVPAPDREGASPADGS